MTEDAAFRGKIAEIIADVLEVDVVDLTENGNLIDDYDADSLGVIEIISRMERDLGVVVPPAEYAQLVDLGSAYRLAATHQPARV